MGSARETAHKKFWHFWTPSKHIWTSRAWHKGVLQGTPTKYAKYANEVRRNSRWRTSWRTSDLVKAIPEQWISGFLSRLWSFGMSWSHFGRLFPIHRQSPVSDAGFRDFDDFFRYLVSPYSLGCPFMGVLDYFRIKKCEIFLEYDLQKKNNLPKVWKTSDIVRGVIPNILAETVITDVYIIASGEIFEYLGC